MGIASLITKRNYVGLGFNIDAVAMNIISSTTDTITVHINFGENRIVEIVLNKIDLSLVRFLQLSGDQIDSLSTMIPYIIRNIEGAILSKAMNSEISNILSIITSTLNEQLSNPTSVFNTLTELELDEIRVNLTAIVNSSQAISNSFENQISIVNPIVPILQDVIDMKDNIAEIGDITEEILVMYDLRESITNLSTLLTQTLINNVDNISSNIASISSVSDNIVALNTLNESIDKIINLESSIDSINNVNNNISSISSISGSIASINSLNNNIDDVTSVADNISSIQNVSTNMSKLTTIINNLTAINNLNGNAALMETVSDNIDAINIVGNNITEVIDLNNHIFDITQVSENIESVSNLSLVVNTPTKITNLNNVTTNLGVIQRIGGDEDLIDGIIGLAPVASKVEDAAASVPLIIDFTNNLGGYVTSLNDIKTEIQGIYPYRANIKALADRPLALNALESEPVVSGLESIGNGSSELLTGIVAVGSDDIHSALVSIGNKIQTADYDNTRQYNIHDSDFDTPFIPGDILVLDIDWTDTVSKVYTFAFNGTYTKFSEIDPLNMNPFFFTRVGTTTIGFKLPPCRFVTLIHIRNGVTLKNKILTSYQTPSYMETLDLDGKFNTINAALAKFDEDHLIQLNTVNSSLKLFGFSSSTTLYALNVNSIIESYLNVNNFEFTNTNASVAVKIYYTSTSSVYVDVTKINELYVRLAEGIASIPSATDTNTMMYINNGILYSKSSSFKLEIYVNGSISTSYNSTPDTSAWSYFQDKELKSSLAEKIKLLRTPVLTSELYYIYTMPFSSSTEYWFTINGKNTPKIKFPSSDKVAFPGLSHIVSGSDIILYIPYNGYNNSQFAVNNTNETGVAPSGKGWSNLYLYKDMSSILIQSMYIANMNSTINDSTPKYSVSDFMYYFNVYNFLNSLGNKQFKISATAIINITYNGVSLVNSAAKDIDYTYVIKLLTTTIGAAWYRDIVYTKYELIITIDNVSTSSYYTAITQSNLDNWKYARVDAYEFFRFLDYSRQTMLYSGIPDGYIEFSTTVRGYSQSSSIANPLGGTDSGILRLKLPVTGGLIAGKIPMLPNSFASDSVDVSRPKTVSYNNGYLEKTLLAIAYY